MDEFAALVLVLEPFAQLDQMPGRRRRAERVGERALEQADGLTRLLVDDARARWRRRQRRPCAPPRPAASPPAPRPRRARSSASSPSRASSATVWRTAAGDAGKTQAPDRRRRAAPRHRPRRPAPRHAARQAGPPHAEPSPSRAPRAARSMPISPSSASIARCRRAPPLPITRPTGAPRRPIRGRIVGGGRRWGRGVMDMNKTRTCDEASVKQHIH